MANLTFEEGVKWAMAIIVALTVLYMIFIHFNPELSERFWGKINNATGFIKIGKEKLEYDFEMPKYMEENVEAINKTILILKNKNIPIDAAGEIIEQGVGLKDFQGCELTVYQDFAGNLKFMVKNTKGQIKYYKSYYSYSPCIINLDDKEKPILSVEKITFLSKDKFKINNEKSEYKFAKLIKKGESICFGGNG